MNETLRVGIVGLRSHGTDHAEMLREMDVEILGSDANPDARSRFESEYGVETFEQPGALYQRDLDAAIITTPNKYHEPAAVAALEAGHDILLEKPLAHTLESAERIAKVADETGQICMVGYYHRFLTVCEILKSYVDRDHLGEIRHIDATYVRRRGIPGHGSWYTSNEIAGGGVLLDIGVHTIDLLLYLLDFPAIEEISCSIRTDFGDRDDYSYIDMFDYDLRPDANIYDVEDNAAVLLHFEDGTTASIELGWAVNDETTHEYRLRGTEAGADLDITFEDEPNDLCFFETRDWGYDHHLDTEVEAEYRYPHQEQLDHFLTAVRSGEKPSMNTVEQALRVQQIVEEIYIQSS